VREGGLSRETWPNFSSFFLIYSGSVLTALAIIVPFIIDSTVAEAMVAWKAVNFCNDLGFHEVIFEGNALTIVNAFRHSEPCWSSYSQLIEDTQIRFHSYKSYVIRHI